MPASAAHAAGQRALLNTLYRTGGEGFGRLASLLLFAQAGRSLGEVGLGAFVFASAFLGFLSVPVDLGLDRYLLRIASRERAAGARLFLSVVALKLAIAIPLWGAAILALHLTGYNLDAQHTVWALVPGVFADSVARTQLAVFQAHERAGPPAVADGLQRTLSAALGIVALRMGYGVVSVGVTYSVGSIVGVLIGVVLQRRTVGLPTLQVRPRGWRRLAAGSMPFATQNIFGMILNRVDTVILALIATQAAVGRYGAAYRLFESSMLISYALIGAFSAMYAYLGPNTDPPLRPLFERSIKLAAVLLTPLSVAFVVLGGPICRLVYGPDFGSAALPLGILGPGVVMLGMEMLATSLMLSREDPRRMIRLTALVAGINVALNVILIPLFGDAGAAAAMLATEALYLVLVMRLAKRSAGGFRWAQTTAGALAGGAAMALVALALHASLWLGLAASLVAYVAVAGSVERVVSPGDVRFVVGLVRRRMGAGSQ